MRPELATDDRGIEISYDVLPAARAALERVGRTEDIKFSPDNRRLAVAGFAHDSIALVGVDISTGPERPHVTVTGVAEFTSAGFHGPHGLDFLDDETIIVANREGSVTVVRLPANDGELVGTELVPIDPPSRSRFELVNAPGSLVVAGEVDGMLEVLVCNNLDHTMTRHLMQVDPLAVTSNEVLLHRWLDIPDGVAVSADNRWIAISNHARHCVMVYERSRALHEDADPCCLLRGALYPHGLRFSADGTHLFVADAASPYVHVHVRDGQTWNGVQYPARSFKVMDDDLFALGRHNPEEGGPKGLDVDRHGAVLCVTSTYQPLAFFDVAAIVARTGEQHDDDALRLRNEMAILELDVATVRAVEARLAALRGSRSFRMTEPLRRVNAVWSRWRR